MNRILAISSQVAYGHVGLSAAVPVLQALGHPVTALPTVMYSNHLGWPHVAGDKIPVEQLEAKIDALDANGWLADHDTLLTGFLPTPDHVALTASLIDRMRRLNPDIRVVVDPIMGDFPDGLYVPEPSAAALRDELIKKADVITPNRYEFGWMTGCDYENMSEIRKNAGAFDARVLVTSAPVGPTETGVLDMDPDGAKLYKVALHQNVPNGVGDVFSALTAAGAPVGSALGRLQALIGESIGADHLRIAETAAIWTQGPTVPASPV